MSSSSSYDTIEQDPEVPPTSHAVDPELEKEEQYGKKSLKMSDLVEFDHKTYGEITKSEWIQFIVFATILFLAGIPLLYFTVKNKPDDGFCKTLFDDSSDEALVCIGNYQLVANALLFLTVFMSVGIIAGIVVVKKRINVGYSRKSLHFSSFFLPFGVNKLFPLNTDITLTLLKFWFVLVIFLLGTKIIRRRFKPFILIFRAIDRPDDRPYTLQWISSQFIASGIVISPYVYLWGEWGGNYDDLVLIIIFIIGIGDGLAEPVGIKFGKHKYKTRAVYYQRKFCSGSFTRSYEGSSVVFIVSLCSLGGFYYIFTTWQLVIAFLTVPIIMTLTEAFSPRTWDSPFLFAVGGGILSGIVKIPL